MRSLHVCGGQHSTAHYSSVMHFLRYAFPGHACQSYPVLQCRHYTNCIVCGYADDSVILNPKEDDVVQSGWNLVLLTRNCEYLKLACVK